MSLGYAERLSYREDLGGQLGDPELQESPASLESKIEKLAALVRDARKIVAFTGAGISCSIGIPDFRGPHGVWTLQSRGLPLPDMRQSFGVARPSLTHMAIVALLRCGKLTHLVSQNVDGVHLRSGIPREHISELHGNCFTESCPRCSTEYVRDFEMESVGFKLTGRSCTKPGCPGQLRDSILDWEDALPAEELACSERLASEADLLLSLGSSLQITPACDIPLKTVKGGGRFVSVNLQATPKDKHAHMVIHEKCDAVLEAVMARAGIPIPPYRRRDTVAVRHIARPAEGGAARSLTFSIQVSSEHSHAHAPPCVAAGRVRLLAAEECRGPTSALQEEEGGVRQRAEGGEASGSDAGWVELGGAPLACELSCSAGRQGVRLQLRLDPAMDSCRRVTELDYFFEAQVSGTTEEPRRTRWARRGGRGAPAGTLFSFTTQEQSYGRQTKLEEPTTKRARHADPTRGPG